MVCAAVFRFSHLCVVLRTKIFCARKLNCTPASGFYLKYFTFKVHNPIATANARNKNSETLFRVRSPDGGLVATACGT